MARFARRNPLGALLGRSRREGFLQRYVIREFSRGRPLDEIMDDAYVRNRSTAAERARLLDSPELVAAIGEQAIAQLRLATTAVR